MLPPHPHVSPPQYIVVRALIVQTPPIKAANPINVNAIPPKDAVRMLTAMGVKPVSRIVANILRAIARMIPNAMGVKPVNRIVVSILRATARMIPNAMGVKPVSRIVVSILRAIARMILSVTGVKPVNQIVASIPKAIAQVTLTALWGKYAKIISVQQAAQQITIALMVKCANINSVRFAVMDVV